MTTNDKLVAALRAARHWSQLAEKAEDTALWEAQIFGPGHSIQVFFNQANQYRRTSKALYLGFWTGEVHCGCCLATWCKKRKAKVS